MLLSIGEILVDIFDDGTSQTAFPGGAPFNVASNASLYTKEVSFIGSVGNDSYGKMLIDEANKKHFKHLHINVLNDRYTSKAIVTLKDGERSFRFDRSGGADYIFNINDIDLSKVTDKDIIHIGSLMLSFKEGRDFFFELVKRIRKETNAKISFDVNYRDDIFKDKVEAVNICKAAIKEADILKFSDEELDILSSKNDLVSQLNDLTLPHQLVVITCGSKGSYLFKDNKLIHVDTYKVKPVDTTGAGDAFYSYFLSSLVNDPSFTNDEEKIKYYLVRANVVGGLATLKKGAINVAPSKEEIEKFLNSAIN